jgi:phosphonopyruvate decarboxylase
MIDPIDFLTGLKEANIRFVTGVPDSLLKDICACFSVNFDTNQHTIASNEGSAVALAIGHYLATASPALVYMQNSGLGNIVNPVLSLADPKIFGVPMILLIGWRGELGPGNIQVKDEPQHTAQGQLTLELLDTLGIPHTVIAANTPAISTVLQQATTAALKRSGPVALVVRKNTFSQFDLPSTPSSFELSREEAIKQIVNALPTDVPVVSTTGMASRELFELRKLSQSGHQRDFLTVGGMGHASQIAAGIALAIPNQRVVCIDGDGALLMHSGGLAVSSECPNLIHIVLNNAAHDSVGGQPTKGEKLHFDEIAAAFGYEHVFSVDSAEDLTSTLSKILALKASVFLEVSCKRGARGDLGRPDQSPVQNKGEFMDFLGAVQ